VGHPSSNFDKGLLVARFAQQGMGLSAPRGLWVFTFFKKYNNIINHADNGKI